MNLTVFCQQRPMINFTTFQYSFPNFFFFGKKLQKFISSHEYHSDSDHYSLYVTSYFINKIACCKWIVYEINFSLKRLCLNRKLRTDLFNANLCYRFEINLNICYEMNWLFHINFYSINMVHCVFSIHSNNCQYTGLKKSKLKLTFNWT